MSTYLLAFVVSDFKNVSAGKISVWTRPDAIDSARYALDVGTRVLDFFEKYFNIPYPLPKLDMIAIPDFGAGGDFNCFSHFFLVSNIFFAELLIIWIFYFLPHPTRNGQKLAMENFGLVTFREVTLLHDENVSAPLNKQRVATIIAHELVQNKKKNKQILSIHLL